MNIHEIILSISGGKAGIHDSERIKAAVQRPSTYTQYTDYDLDTICALLIDSIARGHGFKDGNKRTALMTAVFTYRINRVQFNPNEQMNRDFDELVMSVVLEKPSVKEITQKLQKVRSVHETKGVTWKNFMQMFHNMPKHGDRL